jgi:hypothetical protein
MGKTIVNSVPVYIPFFWADWIGDENVRMMTVGEQGIYLNFLIEQWVYDKVVIKGFARRINARRDAVQQWFKRWTRIVHCPYCERMLDVQEAYAECTRHGQEAYNCKLRNLKNDVNSGVPLGHTEKKPNQEETETKTEPIKLAERSEVPSDSNSSVPSQEKVRTPSGIGVKIVPKFEPKPAPAPKIVSGPALVAAKHFWSCMDEPSSHTPEEWAEPMESLLTQSKLSPDQFMSFLTWVTKENYNDKPTLNSVAYLAKAGNPMASLEKNFVYEDGKGLLRTYKAQLKSGLAAQVKTQTEEVIKHKNTPAMNQPKNKADFYARNMAAMDEEEE